MAIGQSGPVWSEDVKYQNSFSHALSEFAIQLNYRKSHCKRVYPTIARKEFFQTWKLISMRNFCGALPSSSSAPLSSWVEQRSRVRSDQVGLGWGLCRSGWVWLGQWWWVSMVGLNNQIDGCRQDWRRYSMVRMDAE